MFVQGGLATLVAIRRRDYDVLKSRPQVSRWTQARLTHGRLLESIDRMRLNDSYRKGNRSRSGPRAISIALFGCCLTRSGVPCGAICICPCH